MQLCNVLSIQTRQKGKDSSLLIRVEPSCVGCSFIINNRGDKLVSVHLFYQLCRHPTLAPPEFNILLLFCHRDREVLATNSVFRGRKRLERRGRGTIVMCLSEGTTGEKVLFSSCLHRTCTVHRLMPSESEVAEAGGYVHIPFHTCHVSI
jgi:hypothetical protein